MATSRRLYRSFLVRIWRTAGGEQRIEVEQIQAGVKVRLHSLAEVHLWIEARQAEELAADERDGVMMAPDDGEGAPGGGAKGTGKVREDPQPDSVTAEASREE